MYPQKSPIVEQIDSKTYPLGEKIERSNGPALALVALSHTAIERRLYTAMLMSSNASVAQSESPSNAFTVRNLLELTNIQSLSTVRRGLEGLVAKFSVEREVRLNGNGTRDHGIAYRVFTPEEVI